jgi:hypothetical protein
MTAPVAFLPAAFVSVGVQFFGGALPKTAMFKTGRPGLK